MLRIYPYHEFLLLANLLTPYYQIELQKTFEKQDDHIHFLAQAIAPPCLYQLQQMMIGQMNYQST